MEQNVIEIKSGMTINITASVQNMIYVKKLYLELCYMQFRSIYYYLIKYRANQKQVITISCQKRQIQRSFIKMESNDKLREIVIKNATCYYLHDIINIDDFDPHDVLTDKKSHENILVYNILYKSLINSQPLCIDSKKQMDLLELMIELDIQYYLEVKKMIQFTAVSDIL